MRRRGSSRSPSSRSTPASARPPKSSPPSAARAASSSAWTGSRPSARSASTSRGGASTSSRRTATSGCSAPRGPGSSTRCRRSANGSTPPAGWTNLARSSPTDYRVPETLRFRADGVRFEPGALPTPGLYALAASLGLLLEIGLPEVEARIARTLAVLVEGLPRLGFAPVLFDDPPRSGILAARPPAGKDARYYQKRAADENVVISAREGFVRFSPHVGNDEAEAERLLALLKRL